MKWRHPGFSAYVGEAIPFEHKKAMEDVACYLVRNPLSLTKLVYLDGGAERPVPDRGLHHGCSRRILDQLGLSPPEEMPPREVAEVVRLPVHDEGREIGIIASWR